MENAQFILEGYCQGAYPLESHEDIVDKEWHREIVERIKKGDHPGALEIAKEHFTAEFNTADITVFDECGITFVRTLSVSLNLPFIENDGEKDVVLFKWIGGQFLMEGPSNIVENWIKTTDSGSKFFSQEKFDDWFGNEDPLQDGCSYNLGTCCYDLEGFGENGCHVNAESVVRGLTGSLQEFISQVSTQYVVDESAVVSEEVNSVVASTCTPTFTDPYQETVYKINCDPDMKILTIDAVRYFLGLDTVQYVDIIDKVSSKTSKDILIDQSNTLLLLISACSNQFSPVYKECLREPVIEERIKEYWIYILENRDGLFVDTRGHEECNFNQHNYTLSTSCADFLCAKMLVDGAGPDIFIDLSKSSLWTDRLIAARYSTGDHQFATGIEVDHPSVEQIRESLKTDSLVSNNLYVIRDAARLGDDCVWAS